MSGHDGNTTAATRSPRLGDNAAFPPRRPSFINTDDSHAQRVPSLNSPMRTERDTNIRIETPKQEEIPPSRAMVMFSVGFYLVAALVMVMVNKWVLNAVRVPLFFLFCQLVIAVLLLHVSALFGYFKLPRVTVEASKGLTMLVACNVVGLIFNTYCLQYVDASFYQVARGLVLPFTVFFSFYLLQSNPSKQCLVGVGIVCLGFFLGVSTEQLHTSFIGTILGVFSSLTTSVHAIVVKRSLNVVQGSTLDLVYYSNLLSAIVILPLVLFSGEVSVVVDMFLTGGKGLETFLWGATVTGIFGFLICIAGFLSIKVTSPVTHMVSSAVRGVIQTFLGASIFGDIITAGRASGITFILGGSAYYTYVKDQESRAPKSSEQYTPLPTVAPKSDESFRRESRADFAHAGGANMVKSPNKGKD